MKPLGRPQLQQPGDHRVSPLDDRRTHVQRDTEQSDAVEQAAGAILHRLWRSPDRPVASTPW